MYNRHLDALFIQQLKQKDGMLLNLSAYTMTYFLFSSFIYKNRIPSCGCAHLVILLV